MGKRRGKLGLGLGRGRGLGLWLGLAGLLSGCITPEDDDFGADTDTGPSKASVSGSATNDSDGTTTGPDTTDTNDNSSSPTTASASGSSGGDTDGGTDSTTALGDTGSTSDDSNGVTTASDESGTGTTGAAAVTFAAHIQPILNANCGCHQNGGTSGQLVLDAGAAYDNLIGVQSTQAAGVVRVEPMDPAASYLWHKLSGTHVDVGGSGNPMPPGGALLDNQLLMFEQWITDGAMP